MHTGCPPPELLVTVIMTAAPGGVRPGTASSPTTSMFPLKGWRPGAAGFRGRGCSRGPAPEARRWPASCRSGCCSARHRPFSTGPEEDSSAARPWCVGMTCFNPEISRTEVSNRKSGARRRTPRRRGHHASPLGVDSSRPVPESVSRSISTSSALRRNGLYQAAAGPAASR